MQHECFKSVSTIPTKLHDAKSNIKTCNINIIIINLKL